MYYKHYFTFILNLLTDFLYYDSANVIYNTVSLLHLQ